MKRSLLIMFLFCIIKTGFAQTTFTGHLIDGYTQGTGGVFAKDLDNDGDLDVLAAALVDDQVIWWEQYRDSEDTSIIKWNKKVVAYNINSAHSVYADDFDGDGDNDIVAAQYFDSPGIIWWENDFNISGIADFAKHTISSSFVGAHEVFVYDLDKDGDKDILGASSDLHRISWWRNDGGNPIEWEELTIGNNVGMAKSVHAGDIDGDGDIDVVGAALSDFDVILWQNDSIDSDNVIHWTRKTIDYNFNGAHRVQVVDIDNDGMLDVLGAAYMGNEVAWWHNDGDMGNNNIGWTKQSVNSSFGDACVAQAIDLDGDGLKDIVATAQLDRTIAWWKQNKENNSISWSKDNVTSSFTKPWPLYSCDVDGDGDNDIISASSHEGNNQVKWWENNLINPNTTTDISTIELQNEDEVIIYNHPNPFSSQTEITYQLLNDSNVNISIYNTAGELIKNVINKKQAAGTYTVSWNCKSNNGDQVSPGVYLCKIVTKNRIQSTKLLMIK